MPTSHQTVVLAVGRHERPEDGACVMELASMLSGEPFGDHPRSVCPVIGRFLRTLNDGLCDERRQELVELAALAVGTATGRRGRLRRRTLCRRQIVSLRLADAGRVDRWFTRMLRDDAGNACAAAFLEAGRYDEALDFARELCRTSNGPSGAMPGVTREGLLAG